MERGTKSLSLSAVIGRRSYIHRRGDAFSPRNFSVGFALLDSGLGARNRPQFLENTSVLVDTVLSRYKDRRWFRSFDFFRDIFQIFVGLRFCSFLRNNYFYKSWIVVLSRYKDEI